MPTPENDARPTPATAAAAGVVPRDLLRPLRIGLVISELEVGGAEKNLVQLACGLQARGHQVVVYSLDPRPGPGRDQMVTPLESAAIPLRFLPHRPPWPSPWGQIAPLRHQLAADRLDLVYSFLFRANVAVTSAVASRGWARSAGRLPVVIGLRQADPRHWVRWLERRCLLRADAAVCVSTQVAHFYFPQHTPRPLSPPAQAGSPPLPDPIVTVIPNPVPPPTTIGPTTLPWQSADPNPPPTTNLPAPANVDASRQSSPPPTLAVTATNFPNAGRPRFLVFVGRLTRQKGLDQLLTMAADFLAHLPDQHLVLVGQGEQRKWLETLAARLPCHDRIHFLGWKPNPLDYIAAADLLLLASRWEGMPNVILEAMSLGKALVTFQTQGVDDLFFPEQIPGTANPPKEGDPTWLAAGSRRSPAGAAWPDPPPIGRQEAWELQVATNGDRAAFVRAVRKLVESPELAKNVGEWNRQWVRRHFSIDRFVDLHEQLFLMLADR